MKRQLFHSSLTKNNSDGLVKSKKLEYNSSKDVIKGKYGNIRKLYSTFLLSEKNDNNYKGMEETVKLFERPTQANRKSVEVSSIPFHPNVK